MTCGKCLQFLLIMCIIQALAVAIVLSWQRSRQSLDLVMLCSSDCLCYMIAGAEVHMARNILS